MAGIIKALEANGRRNEANHVTLALYFLLVPFLISGLETLLQFPVTSRGNVALSFAFALAFTVPGTFFAWLTTMVLARLPGVQKLPVLPLLMLGYALSILIFSPYNRFVYDVASQLLPHMREMASLRHHGSGWSKITAFLLANLPAVLIWTAVNLTFMARLGFPNLPSAAARRRQAAHDRAEDQHLPAFWRRLEMGDLSKLWSISAEEHYLRLVGDFGARLIRHPFKAAIAQLPPSCGVQVHRSHWVAFGRVARIEEGADVQLVLVDGTVIPVSKSYRRTVQLVGAALLAA